jgi:hypothetical protein
MQIYCAMLFYSCLKKQIIKNGKKEKKKKHRKIVPSSLKIQNFANLFTYVRVRNITYFEFL